MGTKKRTVSHKRNDCIGCGSCELLAGHTWSMNTTDGRADLRGAQWKGDQFMVAQIDEDEIPDVIDAAAACPVQVIRVQGYNG